MKISDLITESIIQMIEESEGNIAEIRRNELANGLGCAPSQINYVLSSRFTPEHGYIVESRRGGGGYIRIKRVVMSHSSAIMHIINSIGEEVDSLTARIVLENCLQSGIIDRDRFDIMSAAIGGNIMRCVPVVLRDSLRAALLKEMLLVQL